MDDDSDNEEFAGMAVDSVDDVQRQRRAEAIAIHAARAAAGLRPEGEGEGEGELEQYEIGTSTPRSEVDLEGSRGRLFDDDDTDHLSVEDSFSLFEDRSQPREEQFLGRGLFPSVGGTEVDMEVADEMDDETGSGAVSESGSIFMGIEEDGFAGLDRNRDREDRASRVSGQRDDAADRGQGLGHGSSSFRRSSASRAHVVRSPMLSAPSTLQWGDIPTTTASTSDTHIDSLYNSIPTSNGVFDVSAPENVPIGGAPRGGSCVVGELIAHKQVRERGRERKLEDMSCTTL
jgi:hypothetical protein